MNIVLLKWSGLQGLEHDVLLLQSGSSLNNFKSSLHSQDLQQCLMDISKGSNMKVNLSNLDLCYPKSGLWKWTEGVRKHSKSCVITILVCLESDHVGRGRSVLDTELDLDLPLKSKNIGMDGCALTVKSTSFMLSSLLDIFTAACWYSSTKDMVWK